MLETGLRWFLENRIILLGKLRRPVIWISTEGSMGVGSSIVLRAWESHVRGEGLDGST